MRAYYYVWCHGPWFDIVGEQLATLGRAGFPATVNVFLGQSSEWAADEVRRLADACGVAVDVQWVGFNPQESLGVAALKRHVDATDTNEPVLYFHAKNVTLKGPYGTKWRWAMNLICLTQWRQRVAELGDHDATGFCYKNDKVYRDIFAGNFWWATSAWLRGLPPIGHGRSRFDYERWLLSKSGWRIKDHCGGPGEPVLDSFYAARGHPEDQFLRWLAGK